MSDKYEIKKTIVDTLLMIILNVIKKIDGKIKNSESLSSIFQTFYSEVNNISDKIEIKNYALFCVSFFYLTAFQKKIFFGAEKNFFSAELNRISLELLVDEMNHFVETKRIYFSSYKIATTKKDIEKILTKLQGIKKQLERRLEKINNKNRKNKQQEEATQQQEEATQQQEEDYLDLKVSENIKKNLA